MLKQFVIVVGVALIVYVFSDYMEGCSYDINMRLDGKVVIVTGANAGIGKETVIDLAKKGAVVYMGCRSMDRGRQAIDDIVTTHGITRDKLRLLKLDLTSFDSVREFVKEYKKLETKLDILINNAGLVSYELDIVDGYERTFKTNHLGPFLLTALLADVVVQSAPSRVVTVSSRAIRRTSGLNFDDLMSTEGYGFMKAYSLSKLANVLFAKELASRLGEKGVTSVSLHPGTINTEIARTMPVLNWDWVYDFLTILTSPFLKDSWHGARTTIYCALDPDVTKNNGAYFDECTLSSYVHPQTVGDEASRRLWKVSSELTKLTQQDTIPELL